MIVGIGTDIVEIARIDVLLGRSGPLSESKFAKRVLSSAEMREFQGHKTPLKFLAKRWVAKESIAKALGTGIAKGVSFQDLIIEHDAHGKPLVSLTGKAAHIAESQGIQHWSITISDEKHYAIAFAVAESRS